MHAVQQPGFGTSSPLSFNANWCPQVLSELVGDKSLERFRVEYEKLYRALKKSHGASHTALWTEQFCGHSGPT